MLNNKSVLITGGTGTLGQALVKRILNDYPKIKRLVIFSRDEQKQYNMEKLFPNDIYPSLRYFIGDVRDEKRLNSALKNIDYVIHTAAMKHVSIAEYNPMECIKTNILGAENVINASIKNQVKSVVALSTDKAAAPINLYGATKLTSDKLFISANNIKGSNDIKFSVVRYGNVFGSQGSVVPFFLNQQKKGVLPITDPKMTRFNISINEGVDLVLHALENAYGGEIFVPKIPSYNVVDMAKAVCPKCSTTIVGIRPGEKLHEEMITLSDAPTTYDLGKYYVILPYSPNKDLEDFIHRTKAQKVKEGFSYNSKDNQHYLKVEELKEMILKFKENFD